MGYYSAEDLNVQKGLLWHSPKLCRKTKVKFESNSAKRKSTGKVLGT